MEIDLRIGSQPVSSSESGQGAVIAACASTAPVPPLAKKRRGKKKLPEDTMLMPCYLQDLPLEILAEILSYASSPRDVLSLARCNKFFCHTLVNNPDTAFIWRRARECCHPMAIGSRQGSAPDVASARIVARGLKSRIIHSLRGYVFAIRGQNIRAIDSAVEDRYKDVVAWIPRLEQLVVVDIYAEFTFMIISQSSRVCVRKTDWEQAVDELNRVYIAGDLDAYLEEKQRLADRLPVIMEHANTLLTWRNNRLKSTNITKKANKDFTKSYAMRMGWSMYELLQTQTYGTLFWSRLAALEKITKGDIEPIHATLEAEIIAIQEHRKRSIAERAYQSRRDDVEKHYYRLKSADANQVLPTLPEFRKLTVMKVMQERAPDATDISKDLRNSPLIDKLLKEDLERWREGARVGLAAVLGFPGWRTASKKRLHPVDRLTARCPHLDKKQRAREEWNPHKFEPDTKVIQAIEQILIRLGTTAEDPASLDAVKDVGTRLACVACPHSLRMDFNNAVRHCKRHDQPRFDLVDEDLAEVADGDAIELGLVAEVMGKSKEAQKRRGLRIYGCRHCRAMQAMAAVVASASGEANSQQTDNEQTDEQTGTAQTSTEATKTTKRKKNGVPEAKLFSFNGLRSHVKEKCEVLLLSEEALLTPHIRRHGITEIGDEDVLCQKDSETA
ncbi:hypothetical protein IEO21_08751 [Rhodonia placenta]|uniref:F-box domain-containing protein n=1 Tax=Rhodonia placenta TaxID=104341 RepID=A0A8H7NVK6_9APHY|nr:hypothetical protein IEO21_08751 [Postia placenta]